MVDIVEEFVLEEGGVGDVTCSVGALRRIIAPVETCSNVAKTIHAC